MAEEKDINFAGISLSIEDLVDPAISFPGEVVVSEFRMASEVYLDKLATSAGVSAADFKDRDGKGLVQWEFQVKRLDAVSVLPDGSEEPFIYWYTGIDLKKWDSEQGLLVPINTRNRKEQLTISTWQAVFGTLQPPTRLVGLKAEFDYWPTKAFGPYVAMRVLTPTAILSEDFRFAGEVRKIPRKAREDEDTTKNAASNEGAPPNNGAVVAPSAAVLAAIKGLAEDADPSALIDAIDSKELTSDVVTAITGGSFVSGLVESGAITIEDGAIAVA